MTSKLDEISEAIGSLRAEVRNLSESSRRADEQRATVHRRVDELVDEVGDLKAEVSSMSSTVADSKAVTDEVKQWKQRGIGALFVTGIASAAISSTFVGFIVYWRDAIMRAFQNG